MNLQNIKRLTDLENELMVAGGGGIVRYLGVDMYTVLYLKCITSKDLLYSTGNFAQCYVAAWMGGEFGREWILVHVWLSTFAVDLKLSQLLISCTPNKKFKNKFSVSIY